MAAFIADLELEQELIAQRQATGADLHDEVWDGVYVMSPIANNEHQSLATLLAAVFVIVLNFGKDGKVQCVANVTDRKKNWRKNYRCPDVLVFLKGNPAENRRTNWLGGPDLAVEIISPGDRAYEKLPFYATVNTREVLIIERDPWMLVLFRLQEGKMLEVARVSAESQASIASEVLPLTFGLTPSEGGPQILLKKNDGTAEWAIDGR